MGGCVPRVCVRLGVAAAHCLPGARRAPSRPGCRVSESRCSHGGFSAIVPLSIFPPERDTQGGARGALRLPEALAFPPARLSLAPVSPRRHRDSGQQQPAGWSAALGRHMSRPLARGLLGPGMQRPPSITAFPSRAPLPFASPASCSRDLPLCSQLPASTDRGGFSLFSWGGLAQARGRPRRLPSDTAPPPVPRSSHLLPLSFRSF